MTRNRYRAHRRLLHARRRPGPAGVHGRRIHAPERPRDNRVELPDPIAGSLLEEDGPECEAAIDWRARMRGAPPLDAHR